MLDRDLREQIKNQKYNKEEVRIFKKHVLVKRILYLTGLDYVSYEFIVCVKQGKDCIKAQFKISADYDGVTKTYRLPDTQVNFKTNQIQLKNQMYQEMFEKALELYMMNIA